MRFRGVSQIVLFNWPFYASALAVTLLALSINPFLPEALHLWVWLGVATGALSVLLTLIASWYVYDWCDPYVFDYIRCQPPERIANIHAGFDESTLPLKRKFTDAAIDTYDFYDPKKHTEASIRRARARHPTPTSTIPIESSHIPAGEDTYDLICLIFAAHEIRDEVERISFFKELQIVSKPGASIYVVEHLRDWRNALVYSIGCLHFHSEAAWQRTFAQSGWRIMNRSRVNAFVISYQLQCIST